MTQDEIISMAKQCGMAPDKYGLFHNIEESEDGADLESFAALVSARAAVIEREACAKVCEPQGGTVTVNGRLAGVYVVLAREIAKAIRARGETA